MQAMIFSAGLGTRFKPWTEKHPKALAPIHGRSLLERNVAYLHSQGIDDIIVNVHHFSEQIIDAIQQNNGWGSLIRISDESNEVLETGGGLMKAKALFHTGEDFMTINVDILTDLDLLAFHGYHRQEDALVSLAVTNRKTSRCFLFEEDDQLVGWRNSQTGEERISIPTVDPTPMAYSGIAIYQYKFLDIVQRQGKFSLVDTFLELASSEKIIGYDHTGDKWVDVGKPASIAQAELLFS